MNVKSNLAHLLWSVPRCRADRTGGDGGRGHHGGL